MFLTADTINRVFELTQKEPIYKEILRKFFFDKKQREEFTQELWLSIFNIDPPEKVVTAWNEKWFRYLFVHIIKKQVLSSSSKWNLNNRLRTSKEVIRERNEDGEPIEAGELDVYEFEEQENEREAKQLKSHKINLILEALNHLEQKNPQQNKGRVDLFKMYFFEGLTYREVSKKAHNIPLSSVWVEIKRTTRDIQKYIRLNKK
jgi:DNA-directed RNA polymerase specialized sigma24 family protein